MTPAAAAAILPAKGSALHIFGMSVSWDALLIAGASLAGILFLYKLGQPNGSFTPSSTVDPGAGGADASLSSTVPALPPQAALDPYAAPATYSGGSSGGILGGAPQGPVGPQLASTTTAMPQSRAQGTVGSGGSAAAPSGGSSVGPAGSAGAAALASASAALSGGAGASSAFAGVSSAAASLAPPAPATVPGYLEGHGATA